LPGPGDWQPQQRLPIRNAFCRLQDAISRSFFYKDGEKDMFALHLFSERLAGFLCQMAAASRQECAAAKAMQDGTLVGEGGGFLVRDCCRI
jgi:hypothetical protein